VPNAALPAVAHFIGRSALRNAFVAEITGVGVLAPGQNFQYSLFFLRALFYALIEFVLGSVFDVPSFRRKDALSMLRGLNCLQHG
jgi:hypothetical protein